MNCKKNGQKRDKGIMRKIEQKKCIERLRQFNNRLFVNSF